MKSRPYNPPKRESDADFRALARTLAALDDPRQVAAFLRIQEQEATWWRDACIAYFQSVAQRPVAAGYQPPQHPLDYYEALEFPYAPGH